MVFGGEEEGGGERGRPREGVTSHLVVEIMSKERTQERERTNLHHYSPLSLSCSDVIYSEGTI